ncbi:MAG: hypothetical protein R2865_08375 [Deinococcales bacterium]
MRLEAKAGDKHGDVMSIPLKPMPLIMNGSPKPARLANLALMGRGDPTGYQDP